ncbi:MAG: hypothetical protein K8I00_08805, partial [Candidatus Omnitrophica bacterium]|nr:hypothetical protein [Candidatus Omnitrophota bacterium]
MISTSIPNIFDEIKAEDEDMTGQILATQEGIKSVGVGKRGSRELTAELLERIVVEIQAGVVPDVVKGAFLAGLLMKGPTHAECRLDACFETPILDDPEKMVGTIAAEIPPALKLICQTLLSKQELSTAEALELGRFLMSSQKGDGARGLAASVLRVRYETPDEYAGLWQSLAETFTPEFV